VLLNYDVAGQVLQQVLAEGLHAHRAGVLNSEVIVKRFSSGVAGIKPVHVVDKGLHVSFSDLSNLLAVSRLLFAFSCSGGTGSEAFSKES